jgi:hypothetical protein
MQATFLSITKVKKKRVETAFDNMENVEKDFLGLNDPKIFG